MHGAEMGGAEGEGMHRLGGEEDGEGRLAGHEAPAHYASAAR